MQEKKNKFYQRRWFLWLFLILFPPVGIILLWTCHKEMKKNTRIILTVVFGIWFIMMYAMRGGVQDGYKAGIQNTTPATTQTERHESSEATSEQRKASDDTNQSAEDEDQLPVEAESACRALTRLFIKNVVKEDYSMWAFNVKSFDLDKKGKGTIKILYMPSDAGNGATKVNFTIKTTGKAYKITYALLAGINEVDLSTVPSQYREFTVS